MGTETGKEQLETQLQLTLNGSATVTHELGDIYNPGATADDYELNVTVVVSAVFLDQEVVLC